MHAQRRVRYSDVLEARVLGILHPAVAQKFEITAVYPPHGVADSPRMSPSCRLAGQYASAAVPKGGRSSSGFRLPAPQRALHVGHVRPLALQRRPALYARDPEPRARTGHCGVRRPAGTRARALHGWTEAISTRAMFQGRKKGG